MHIAITEHHSSETCHWCEKTKECVTANFDDSFIGTAAMCWPCLQKAVKVQSRQQSSVRPPSPAATDTPHTRIRENQD